MSADDRQNRANDTPSEQDDAVTGGGGRFQSTIAFPYGSLKDAEQIAEELHREWGDSASPEQLAASLGSTPRSGAFRMKVATARVFGVVTVSRGKISLTPAGRQIIDPQTRAAARVQAFLAVPLFKAIHEEYKSSLLPPDAALENKMAELGVSVKQTAKARQAFQRSADLAGFFKQGRNRLVAPPAKLPDSSGPETPEPRKDDQRVSTRSTADTLPAPVQDLWLTLLRDGRSWSAEKTQEFVDAARKLHELLTKSS